LLTGVDTLLPSESVGRPSFSELHIQHIGSFSFSVIEGGSSRHPGVLFKAQV
jgi:hypothetical protein